MSDIAEERPRFSLEEAAKLANHLLGANKVDRHGHL